MELLVGGGGGPEHVVIDATLGDALEDRPPDRRIAPAGERDERGTFRIGVQLRDLRQELTARLTAEPLAGEDDRDLGARRREVFEPRAPLRHRWHADDLVVTAVAIGELVLDVGQAGSVAVDAEQDRSGHDEDTRTAG